MDVEETAAKRIVAMKAWEEQLKERRLACSHMPGLRASQQAVMAGAGRDLIGVSCQACLLALLAFAQTESVVA